MSFKRRLTKKPEISDAEFICLNAMLMALVAISVNMILPAFQNMTANFGLPDQNMIGLSVTLLFGGLAVGQMVFGPLSDSFGRKSAMNFGLALFIAGTAISYYSTDFTALLMGQIVQGLGLGAPRVVSLAIVRDRFAGDAMGRIMSFIMVIFVMVPTVSPFLGQSVILAFEWRSLFIVFGAAGALMALWMNVRLVETLVAEKRSRYSFANLYSAVLKVAGNRVSMGYAVSLGLVSSAFIAYLNMSQQILQVQYGLGVQYPLYFGALSLSLAAASFINGRIVLWLGMEALSLWALVSMCLISVAGSGWLVWSQTEPGLWGLLTYLAAMLFGFGILVSNLNALAMRSLGEIAGMGAAIVGALSTLISIPFAIWIGGFYAGSILPLTGGFALFSGLALVLFMTIRFRFEQSGTET